MAAVGVHPLTLVAQAGVHQTIAGGRDPRAGQQAGGRALAPGPPWGHHGELVGAGACAIVEVVGRGVGLEVAVLALVAGVRRGQVGVVAGGG